MICMILLSDCTPFKAFIIIVESLAESKIKNNIEQLLSRYKHGNNIHEY